MLAPWLLPVVVAAELFSRGLAPVDAGATAQVSAAVCLGCHPTVHGEWAQSRHGQAWTNAIFQREYRERPLEWCVHCHAPLVEQLAEVRSGGGSLADEGVNCAACHLRGGRVVARARAAGSPHDTDVRSDFGNPAFCGGCHQFNFPVIEREPAGQGPGRVTGYTGHPMQDTVAQHARGPQAATPCLSCHRGEAPSHRFPGGHDPDMLARALSVETCRAGGTLVVSLTNAGAGHNVPTGDLHRHLVLRAWHASAPEKLREVTLGRRFAPAPDGGKRTVADTTIRAGETRRLALPMAEAARSREPLSLELRLVYTVDEFPFRGREVAAPTFATMLARELDWKSLPRCRSRR